MKNTTIKQLADQGITITKNGGMYEVQKSGKSVTIFKSFNDALEFAGKQIVLGESMIGFNETGEITIDDAIRHLECMDKEYDLDSYAEDVINMVVNYLKERYDDGDCPKCGWTLDGDYCPQCESKVVVGGGVIEMHESNDGESKLHPLPQLCYGDCGKVYEHRHLNHIDDPHGDEVLLFCTECAFQFVARLHEKDDSPTMDEIRESCGEELN